MGFFSTNFQEILNGKPNFQGAVISGNVSPGELKNVIPHFNCITFTDSEGLLPIQLDVKHNSNWKDGIQDIVKATSLVKGSARSRA